MAEPFPAEARALIEALREQVAQRDLLIEQLLARVEALEERLGKNSGNSSKPPSSDGPFRRPPPRSLRSTSGRRPGKQPGDPGAHLEAVADPDRVEVHVPVACSGCGDGLDTAVVVSEQVRQVFDLPAARVEVTEHRAQARRCGCGTITRAVFPARASAPTCYGPRAAAVATYLLIRQHVPVARTAEILSDLLGLHVSSGWVAGLPTLAADRLGAATALTRHHLQAAPVAHFDETGARVAGRLWWVHVACTDRLTSYHRAAGRGRASADQGGVLPAFTGIGIHDGLTSYRGYEQMTHGLCNAHHLRELVALTETHQRQGRHDITWPQAMIDLLCATNTLVTSTRQAGHTRLRPTDLIALHIRYRGIIAQGHAAHPPPPPTGKRGRPRLETAGSLLRRLDIYQDDILRFATDLTVPFDNNQAERDIRMIRVQQKISGSWRSETGADAYLAVRSYLSTARKQHRNALAVLKDTFNGTPWLPATT